MTISQDTKDRIQLCAGKHPDWKPGRIADSVGCRVPDVHAVLGKPKGAPEPAPASAKQTATPTATVRTVRLADLSGECQVRAGTDPQTVAEYAEAMREGNKFPPIIVYASTGGLTLIADGFHRVEASEGCGFVDISAEVRQGTRLDAIRCALGANRTHGKRMTNADKRHAVTVALEEVPDLSLRELADLVGVSHEFVRGIKDPSTKTGKASTVDTGADKSGHSNVGGHKDGKTGSGKPKAKASADPIREDGMSPDSLTKDGVDGDMDPLVNSLAAIWRRATNEQKRDFIAWVEDNGGVPTEE